jgi:predicted RNA binding protein YcfA (HicA-like mRNA interferase family)
MEPLSAGAGNLSRLKKLLKKARENRKNLKFNELCRLFEYFGFQVRGQEGSHIQYKRYDPPSKTVPIQNIKGKANPYQVKQLLDFVDDNDLSGEED